MAQQRHSNRLWDLSFQQHDFRQPGQVRGDLVFISAFNIPLLIPAVATSGLEALSTLTAKAMLRDIFARHPLSRLLLKRGRFFGLWILVVCETLRLRMFAQWPCRFRLNLLLYSVDDCDAGECCNNGAPNCWNQWTTPGSVTAGYPYARLTSSIDSYSLAAKSDSAVKLAFNTSYAGTNLDALPAVYITLESNPEELASKSYSRGFLFAGLMTGFWPILGAALSLCCVLMASGKGSSD